MPNLRYSLYVLAAAVSSGVSWVLTEIALRFYGAEPVFVALGGNLMGGILLLILTRKANGNGYKNWSRQNWLMVLAVAFTIYTLGFLLTFNAVQLIGAGKTVLLARLDTIFVVTLAILFLGEQFSLRHGVAGLFAIGGAILINFDPTALQLTLGWGETLAILGPFSIAVGIIIFKSLIDRADAGQVTGLALFLGAVFIAPLTLFEDSSSSLVGPVLLVIVLMGIVRGGGWLIYNIAMSHLGASRAAIIFLSSGFFTILFQLIVSTLVPALGLQPPKNLLTAVFGAILIAVGIIILQMDSKMDRGSKRS